MSLLDQLASYCCQGDQFMFQILFTDEPSTASYQSSSQKSYIFEDKTLNNNNSFDKNDVFGNYDFRIERKTQQIQKQAMKLNDYQQRYVKLTKFVGVLVMKVKKLEHQLMIQLKRRKDNSIKQQADIRNNSLIDNKLSQKQINKFLLDKKIEQIISLINEYQINHIKKAFNIIKIHNKQKSTAIILGQILKNICSHNLAKFKNTFFQKFKAYKKGTIHRFPIQKNNRVNFSLKMKAALIKTQLQQSPLQGFLTTGCSQLYLNMPCYPQFRQQQSIDHYDNTHIFFNNQDHYSQYDYQEKLFSVMNISEQSFIKKEDSPNNSMNKQISQQQFTAQKSSSRKRISEFTINSNHVSEQIQQFQDIISNLYSKTMNTSQKAAITMQHNYQEKTKKHKIYQIQKTKRFICQKGIEVWHIQNNINDHNDMSIPQADWNQICPNNRISVTDCQIQEKYDEQMSCFLQFKRSIQKRRQSTIKQIQQSKDLIKRLMVQFKQSKEKIDNKQQLINSRKKKRETMKSQGQRNSGSKYNPNAKEVSKPKKKGSKKKQLSVGKNSIEGQNKKRLTDNQSFENMQIFFKYIKEKDKMKMKMGKAKTLQKTQGKRNSIIINVSELVNPNKYQTSKKSTEVRTNALKIGRYSDGKQLRVQLKVELVKDKTKVQIETKETRNYKKLGEKRKLFGK